MAKNNYHQNIIYEEYFLDAKTFTEHQILFNECFYEYILATNKNGAL